MRKELQQEVEKLMARWANATRDENLAGLLTSLIEVEILDPEPDHPGHTDPCASLIARAMLLAGESATEASAETLAPQTAPLKFGELEFPAVGRASWELNGLRVRQDVNGIWSLAKLDEEPMRVHLFGDGDGAPPEHMVRAVIAECKARKLPDWAVPMTEPAQTTLLGVPFILRHGRLVSDDGDVEVFARGWFTAQHKRGGPVFVCSTMVGALVSLATAHEPTRRWLVARQEHKP